MKDVVLLNEDYKSVLKQYDSPTTIFYLDPPYVNMEKYYEEQSIDPHEFANVCSTLQGKFVLSYSNDSIVLDAFKDEKFFISEVPMTYTSGRKSKKTTEILITNFFIL
jgi:DNA adenine methylase